MKSPEDSIVKEIKELARKFSPEQLDTCIREQLHNGANTCDLNGPTDEVIAVLSKAEYVKGLVENGTPLVDAVRQLARKIRVVQSGFESG